MKQAKHCLMLTGLVALMAWSLAGADADRALPAKAKTEIQRETDRQVFVRDRLKAVVKRFDELVLDLHSNGYLEDAAEKQLLQLTANLSNVNDQHVAKALADLQAAVAALPKADPQLHAAGTEVEIILRELGDLMVKANAAQARAMLLSELRELIVKEDALNRECMGWGRQLLESSAKPDAGKNLAASQDALANRAAKFVNLVFDSQKAETDPMAALRLGSVYRLLVDRQVKELLAGAVSDLNQANAIEAVRKQQDALTALREVERLLLPDKMLDQLLKTKEALRRILEDQVALRLSVERTRELEFAAAKNDAYTTQRGLTKRLGDIDASLFNPPVDNTATAPAVNGVTAALGAMGEAEKAIEAAQQAPAVASQKQAEEYLRKALADIEAMLKAAGNLDDLRAQVERARRMLAKIREFEARHGEIMEATSQAAKAAKGAEQQAQPQKNLSTDVIAFVGEIQPSPYADLIKKALTTAAQAMVPASQFLAKGQPVEAQPPQLEAAAALAEARGYAERELDLAEGRLAAAAAAADSRAMAERIAAIAAQQHALTTQATNPNAGNVAPLATTQAALAGATSQAAADAGGEPTTQGAPGNPTTQGAPGNPTSQGAPGNATSQNAPGQTTTQGANGENPQTSQPAGEPEPSNILNISDELLKAMLAQQEAARKLEQNAPRLASPYMKQAEDILHLAQHTANADADLNETREQATADLEKIDIEILNLLQRQKALREQTEKIPEKLLPTDMSGEQTVLRAEAVAAGEGDEIIGKDLFAKAAAAMQEAIDFLNKSDRKNAVAAQKRAEKELADVEAAMREAAKKITQAEQGEEEPAEPENGEPEKPGMEVLTKTLVVAAKQRALRLQARQTPVPGLPKLSGNQTELKDVTDTLGGMHGGAVAQEFFDAASGFMGGASTDLTGQKAREAIGKQQSAEIELRKAIVALARRMTPHPPPPNPPPRPERHPTRPMPEMTLISFEGERSFDKEKPEGEKVQRDKSVWDSLGPREREAVNENFSRDLPVEYRELLKDYFEALAKMKPEK